jgi:hypothetical protein
VVVADRVQVDPEASRPGGIMPLHWSATANEQTGASQEALP